MAAIVENDELYLIHFSLKAAYKEGIVTFIGSYNLPSNFTLPKKMRAKHIMRGEFICWHIVDYETWKNQSVKKLTEEQKRLSPWGTWNDTLLIERLADGWTLENWK